MNEHDQSPHLTDTEKAAYDLGFHAGQAATDHKLEEALRGLQRGNDKLADVISKMKHVIGERDAILEEYARISWAEALRGAAAVGMHHPSAHSDPRDPKRAAKLGVGPCKRCKQMFVSWDTLDASSKADKMKKTWGVVMQIRARREIERSGMLENAPTTQDFAAKGVPTPLEDPPPIIEFPLKHEELLKSKCGPKHPGDECRCGHVIPHCCQHHCCCGKGQD